MASLVYEDISLFQDFTPDQIEAIRARFIPYECFAGTVLFSQGEAAIFLYLLLVGEVAIYYKPYDGPKITLSHIYPEGVVGWSAAIGNAKYTSSAVCMADSQMLRISGKDLRELSTQYPEVWEMLLERMASTIARRIPCAQAQVMAMLENGLRIGNK